MKKVITSVLALSFALGLSAPARSVERLAVYDNFDVQRISPDLWDPRTIDPLILMRELQITHTIFQQNSLQRGMLDRCFGPTTDMKY